MSAHDESNMGMHAAILVNRNMGICMYAGSLRSLCGGGDCDDGVRLVSLFNGLVW